MKTRNLFQSFNCAFRGVHYVINTERNMRIHLLIAAAVLIGAFIFRLSPVEFTILFFTITLVLLAEMVNTVIEATLDIVAKDSYNPLIKTIKDIAAGGVLITAASALFAGCVIFYRHLLNS